MYSFIVFFGNVLIIAVAAFESSNLSTTSVIPNSTILPRAPLQVEGSTYVGRYPISVGPGQGSEVYELSHSTANGYDEMLYNRSSAMVVNPMDGLIWDLPDDMCGHIVHQ